MTAAEVVTEEIARKKIEIQAAAAQSKCGLKRKRSRRYTRRYEAEAEGLRKVLDAKAQGTSRWCSCIVMRAAATLLMIEKLDGIVEKQVDAISNLKIDKITVWDSGSGNKDGSTTSNFYLNMMKSLPPLHDVAKMAGLNYLTILGR